MEWFDKVVLWFKETFSFVDAELLMMVGIVIMSVILLKLLFKGLHRFRILKIIIAIIVFGGLTLWAVNYVDTHKDLFSKETRFYVYGRVNFISESIRKMDVVSTKTNFLEGGKGRIVVKFPLDVTVVSSKSSEGNISISDIKPGDMVQVYCEQNMLRGDDNEVKAIKVVRLYNK